MPPSSRNPDPPLLVWTEVSTTGTDDRLDYLLEIAVVITDFTAELQDRASIAFVIEPGGDRWKARLADNSSLSDIHSKSGLLLDISNGHGQSVTEAEVALVQMLRNFGAEQDYALAGSGASLGLSSRFIRSGMPRLNRWLRTSPFDLGTLEASFRRAEVTIKPPPPRRKRKQHRLLDDMQHQVEYARLLIEYIGS
jgi:oligoribonuclease (3'-5' exoribonuclease)